MTTRVLAVAAEAETRYPREWKLVYPRVYEGVGAYHSPKELATDLLGALLLSPQRVNWNLTKLGLPDQHALVAASLLVTQQVPTFFVARNLLEAVAQTQPPAPIAWKDMHLPFEAAAFVFPRGALKHTSEGECGFLWYSRLRGGTVYRHPLIPQRTFEIEEDKIFFRAGLDGSLGSLMHGLTESATPTIQVVDLSGLGTRYRGVTTELLNQDDEAILQSAISLSLGVLLVMLERPQIITLGGFTGKRTKGGGEFWVPNIIGRAYRPAGHPGEGGGVSPRMHWRRGHWRAQAWGEQHLLRKVIWIEPTLVAAESEPEQSDRSG